MPSTMDLAGSGGADFASAVTPVNMPGMVDCYGTNCSTSGADPVCCDSATDGGFADTCVASAAACLATDSSAKTFECGQAADCSGGKVCCGDIGKANSGKSYFKSTSCAASCTSTQTQLCVSASECKSSGAHCIGQSISGRDVGLCE